MAASNELNLARKIEKNGHELAALPPPEVEVLLPMVDDSKAEVESQKLNDYRAHEKNSTLVYEDSQTAVEAAKILMSILDEKEKLYLIGKKRKADTNLDCNDFISVQDRKHSKDSKIKYNRNQTKGKHRLNMKFGQNLVGSNIKVWWKDDDQFYEGVIASFNQRNKKHKVLYDDGDIEFLNMRNETWEFVGTIKNNQENLVYSRIKVWWPEDSAFYEGIIASFNRDNKKHKVIYDDGDKEILNLENEKWEIVNYRAIKELSLGCNNKKTNVSERFSEVSREKTAQESKTVFEQRSNDEIPMDIVEFMAKNQYERGLSESERNSFLAKRIDHSNSEVMGISDGHGNEVRSMQNEHNRWNSVFSQINNNQCVAYNRDGSHVSTKFGTRNSASRTLISNDPQIRLWNGDNLVHRSSQTDPQVLDPYNKAHDGPQPSGKNWACGASSLAHLKPNFPERMASQTSHLPPLQSLDSHKGKTIRDFDLNRADPNDSDVGVLLPFPFVPNNTGSASNRKEMESSRSYFNEATPAMQLLSLMDAGIQSHAPFSVDGKKLTEKPLFPFNNHHDLSMYQRENLFGNPLFPQYQELKRYYGSEAAANKSSPSTRPMPSAYIGKTCNAHKGQQIRILGASAEVALPIQRNPLKNSEIQRNVSSCHMHGTIMPLKDISQEEVCILSRNPADFSIPEAGNVYMIGSGDLKISKDFSCRYRGFDGQEEALVKKINNII